MYFSKDELQKLSREEIILRHFKARLGDFKRNTQVTKNGCWIYKGRTSEQGYGTALIQGINYKLHRASWMVKNKKILSSAQLVCHKCNNPSCWNPDHLYVGTASDNAADRIAAGISNRKTPKETVIAIKVDLINGLTPKEISKKYGVSTDLVRKIGRGDRHANIQI